MIRTVIENAIVAWLIEAGASAGVPDADRSVILADQPAARPPLPYCTVRVMVYDITVHTDEDIVDGTVSPPTTEPRGLRTGTVSVNSFGPSADAWLGRAAFMLRTESIRAALGAAGLTVRPVGGINNLTGLRDTEAEVRYQRDFAIDYRRVAEDFEAVPGVPLEEVVHVDEYRDDELDSGTAADLIVTTTEDLT